MTNQTPTLRFKIFNNSWATKRLDEISSIERGRFSPRPRNDPRYYGGKIPFVQTGDVVKSGGKISLYSQTLNEEGLKVSKLFPKGTILITIAANIGFSGVLAEDMACPDSLIGLKPKKGTHNWFLNYLLQIEQVRMDSLAAAAAQKNINVEFLKAYKFTLPDLEEQQKIASFLSSVDERIELLEKKKEKLEVYKKGVMQQIFSQQIRFRQDDGAEFPDWEERKFSDLYNFKSTNSLSRERLNYDRGKFRNIHYGDIHTKFNTLLDVTKTKLPFLKDDVVLKDAMLKNQVRNTDLIIADASEDYKDIGKTIEVIDVSDIPVLAGLHTIHASQKSQNLECGFGGYLMQSYWVRRQIMRIAQGTKVLSISATRVEELDLIVPVKEEQRKIVAFLKSIDQTVSQLDNQIQRLRNWKKGLLQQIFP